MPTPEQEKTIEDLHSHVDDLETADDLEYHALVFIGNSVDGPVHGMIYEDGKIHWIAGEINLERKENDA